MAMTFDDDFDFYILPTDHAITTRRMVCQPYHFQYMYSRPCWHIGHSDGALYKYPPRRWLELR